MQCMNKDSDTNESSSLNLSDAVHALQVYVQMLANRDPWNFLLKSKGVIKVTRCYQSLFLGRVSFAPLKQVHWHAQFN